MIRASRKRAVFVAHTRSARFRPQYAYTGLNSSCGDPGPNSWYALPWPSFAATLLWNESVMPAPPRKSGASSAALTSRMGQRFSARARTLARIDRPDL